MRQTSLAPTGSSGGGKGIVCWRLPSGLRVSGSAGDSSMCVCACVCVCVCVSLCSCVCVNECVRGGGVAVLTLLLFVCSLLIL